MNFLLHFDPNKCELWLIVKLSLATQFQPFNFEAERYKGCVSSQQQRQQKAAVVVLIHK